jgi:hypothetical protein
VKARAIRDQPKCALLKPDDRIITTTTPALERSTTFPGGRLGLRDECLVGRDSPPRAYEQTTGLLSEWLAVGALGASRT